MASATDSARVDRLGKGLSLRWKMLLAFGLVGLVGVVTVALLANQAAAREVRGFMYRGGMTDSGLLASELAAYYRGRGSWEGVEAMFGDQPGGPDMLNHPGMAGMMAPRLRLASTDGTLLAGGRSSGGGSVDQAELTAGTPVVVDGQTVGVLLIETPGVSSLSSEVLGRVNRGILAAALAAGAAALFIGWALAAGMIRPVRHLTQAARAVARGDLSQRVPVGGRDELSVLGSAFNHMADSLERAERLRRDMTADVAHELRNPLAILQAQVEALIDGVYPLTTENLAPVLGQAQVLSRLVEDLRTLALADSGQLSLEPAKVDLHGLAAGLIEAIRPQADAQHLRLELAGASAWAMVDRLRIEQALGNLIANALRHTPPGGEVQVRIDPPQAEGLVTLTVVDSGEGIPGEALPFVFERFYRADKARARAEGGTGLGLAITRQLVEAHGGTVTAGNRPEGGAVFTLRLPSAQAPPAVPA